MMGNRDLGAFCAIALLTAVALPGLSQGQSISGLSVTTNPGNSANAFQDVTGTVAGFQRGSATSIVSSSATAFETRYVWVNGADTDNTANGDVTSVMTSDYTVQFTVTAPGAYDLLVTTTRNAGFNLVSDASGGSAATASMSAITGMQSGGTLSGSLGMAAPTSLSGNAGGSSSIDVTNPVATISGTSNGSPIGHTLNFSWTSTCLSDTAGPNAGDACGQRGGLPVSITGLGVAGYPGTPARTQGDDGHFVDVTLVSYCGDSVVQAGKGEGCDEGPANGTSGSCCNADCTLKTGTECRASAGDCDVAELCDGINGACPPDDFAPPSTLCRAASAGEACDAADFCDGLNPNCPADGVLPNGTTCRMAAGVCDLAETCDGVSFDCPADGPKSTAECRGSTGVCDLPDFCDGIGNDCPADAKSTAECRGSAGVCDTPDFCDGIGDDCPADAKSTVECRASMGACDTPESCDGVGNDCPADSKSTAVCRGSAGDCDIVEVCDGLGDDCPADQFQLDTTVCRPASAGEACDIAETCTGSSADCPADAVEPDTTSCRPAAGVCDVAETCDGVNKTCPADAVEPSSTVCRAASAGEACDAAETCDGVGVDCPADGVLSNGTTCRVAAGVCDLAETCDGVSFDCPADGKSTAECRAAAGVCDMAETCDGIDNDCPADGYAADGTDCDDADYCNGVQTCTAGVCGGGTNPCMVGESCDEGSDSCYTGNCPPSPSACLTAMNNKVLIKDNATDSKDKLLFKWIKGAETTQTDFADPTMTANYALCFYAGAVPALVESIDVPGSNSLWSPISTKGYKYKDKGGTVNGITKIIVKSGAAGKSKAIVKGKGVNLPDFGADLPMPVDMADLPLIVQLRNSGSGKCFEGTFATPKKNDAAQFSAKDP